MLALVQLRSTQVSKLWIDRLCSATDDFLQRSLYDHVHREFFTNELEFLAKNHPVVFRFCVNREEQLSFEVLSAIRTDVPLDDLVLSLEEALWNYSSDFFALLETLSHRLNDHGKLRSALQIQSYQWGAQLAHRLLQQSPNDDSKTTNSFVRLGLLGYFSFSLARHNRLLLRRDSERHVEYERCQQTHRDFSDRLLCELESCLLEGFIQNLTSLTTYNRVTRDQHCVDQIFIR